MSCPGERSVKATARVDPGIPLGRHGRAPPIGMAGTSPAMTDKYSVTVPLPETDKEVGLFAELSRTLRLIGSKMDEWGV